MDKHTNAIEQALQEATKVINHLEQENQILKSTITALLAELQSGTAMLNSFSNRLETIIKNQSAPVDGLK